MNTGNNSSHDLSIKSSFLISLRNKGFKIIKQMGKFGQDIKQMPLFKTLVEKLQKLQKVKKEKKEKKGKKVWWSGIIIVLVAIGIAYHRHNNTSFAKQASAHTTPAGDYLQQRLQDISDQLATIRLRLDQTNSDALSQQVNGIIDQMKDLSSTSNQLITDQIQSSTATLQKQLQSIHTVLVKLQKEEEHVKYLKPSDLPFKVVSIDNIQQNNVVTIDYNDTTFPIEAGSYVAIWKLISADFVAQKAEFVNSKKQHVVVDLNRLEQHR